MEARRAVVEPELPATLVLFEYGHAVCSPLLSAWVTDGGSVPLQPPPEVHVRKLDVRGLFPLARLRRHERDEVFLEDRVA